MEVLRQRAREMAVEMARLYDLKLEDVKEDDDLLPIRNPAC